MVSPDLWDAAQLHLSSHRGENTWNHARPMLLRGMIIRGLCTRSMWPSQEHGRLLYRCSSRETPGGACGSKRTLSEGAGGVEAGTWDGVATGLRDPALIAAEVQRRREAARRSLSG